MFPRNANRPMGALCSLLATALLAVGCGGHDGPKRVASRASAVTPPSQPASGACSPSKLASGAPPAWANLPGVPAPPSPYAVGAGDRIAAFLFTYPERAHLPPNASNKVLWAVGDAQKAGTLRIGARLLGRRARPLEIRLMAGDESARIQRSRTRYPAPGCWRLTARWGSRTATFDLRVR